MRKPLQQPCTVPHEVIRRYSEKVYTIQINGKTSNVSVYRLKPAFLPQQDVQTPLTPKSQHFQQFQIAIKRPLQQRADNSSNFLFVSHYNAIIPHPTPSLEGGYCGDSSNVTLNFPPLCSWYNCTF